MGTNSPPEVYGQILEHMDVASLTTMENLSRSWRHFINRYPYQNTVLCQLFQQLWEESITPYVNLLGYSPYAVFMYRFKLLGLHELDQGLQVISSSNVCSQIHLIRKISCDYFFNSLLIERKRELVLTHCSQNFGNFNEQSVEMNLAHLKMNQEEIKPWIAGIAAYQHYQFLDSYSNRIQESWMSHFFHFPLHAMSTYRLEAKWFLIETILLAKSQNNSFFDKPTYYQSDFAWLSQNVYLNFIHTQYYITIWKRLSPTATFDSLSKKLLLFAAENHHWEVLPVLIAERDCSVKCDQTGRTVLHYLAKLAVQESTWESIQAILKSLIDQGCSVVEKDNDGFSPLICAIDDGDAILLDFFLGRLKEAEKEEASTQISQVLNKCDLKVGIAECLVKKDFLKEENLKSHPNNDDQILIHLLKDEESDVYRSLEQQSSLKKRKIG